MLDTLKNNFLILSMNLDELIKNNPALFRVIAIVGGLLIGYLIYIIQI